MQNRQQDITTKSKLGTLASCTQLKPQFVRGAFIHPANLRSTIIPSAYWSCSVCVGYVGVFVRVHRKTNAFAAVNETTPQSEFSPSLLGKVVWHFRDNFIPRVWPRLCLSCPRSHSSTCNLICFFSFGASSLHQVVMAMVNLFCREGTLLFKGLFLRKRFLQRTFFTLFYFLKLNVYDTCLFYDVDLSVLVRVRFM